jgi:hypothetical protein
MASTALAARITCADAAQYPLSIVKRFRVTLIVFGVTIDVSNRDHRNVK